MSMLSRSSVAMLYFFWTSVHILAALQQEQSKDCPTRTPRGGSGTKISITQPRSKGIDILLRHGGLLVYLLKGFEGAGEASTSVHA